MRQVLVSCLSAKYGQYSTANNDALTWHLPGHGKSKDSCGEFLKALKCPDYQQPTLTGVKHDRFVTLKHCFDPECPICYEAWAAREGNRAAERFDSAHTLYFKDGLDLQGERHIVFSPPQAEAIELLKTKKGYKKLKSDAIKLIKKAGVVGGAIIFHPFRQNHTTKTWYLSPHFHVVGYGYLQNFVDFHAKTGWVYKNLGVRATLTGTIIYALTHCGLAYQNDVRVFHALTWFGLLSYNKIVKESVMKEKVTIPCSLCSLPLHEHPLVVNPGGHGMGPDWSNDLGVYRIIVKKIVYRLKIPIKAKLKNANI